MDLIEDLTRKLGDRPPTWTDTLLAMMQAATAVGIRPTTIIAHVTLPGRVVGKNRGGVEWRLPDGTRVVFRRLNKLKLAWSASGRDESILALGAIAARVPRHLLRGESWREPPGGKPMSVEDVAKLVTS